MTNAMIQRAAQAVLLAATLATFAVAHDNSAHASRFVEMLG
jgi:hypothetical protein